MLQIRPEQMKELEKVAGRRFEGQLLDHIKEHFPRHYEILGEPTLREVIRYGLERAETYGFTTERDLCLYIGLMLCLGSNFDDDPQLPWASGILKAKTISEPATRMMQLDNEAQAYLDRAAGEGNELLRSALLTVQKNRIAEPWQPQAATLEQSIVRELRAIWPHKCHVLGEAGLGDLAHEGVEAARKHGLATGRGALIYVGVMFLLGSGFDTDPQCPWAARILSDPALKNPAEKAEQLYGAAMSYLEKWLS